MEVLEPLRRKEAQCFATKGSHRHCAPLARLAKARNSVRGVRGYRKDRVCLERRCLDAPGSARLNDTIGATAPDLDGARAMEGLGDERVPSDRQVIARSATGVSQWSVSIRTRSADRVTRVGFRCESTKRKFQSAPGPQTG